MNAAEKPFNHVKLITIILLTISIYGCTAKSNTPIASFKFIAPDYNTIAVVPTTDTLNFHLDSATYSSIKSMNMINYEKKDYFVFFDSKSTSICYFDVKNQQLAKKITLKKSFPISVFSKTSVTVKSYDSIFFGTRKCIYMLDGNGAKRDSILVQNNPYELRPYFKNTWPALLRNDSLYIGLEPSSAETEPKQLREKYIIYAIDLKTRQSSLMYGFPSIYLENFYGYNFLRYSYCLNDKGNAVFSFPADSNIYETDFRVLNNAYSGKSKYQTVPISPIKAEDENHKYDFDSFEVRNSYGPIYYDKFNKRYLRIALSGLPKNETMKKRAKKPHVIILDENFKIIGESELDDKINLSYLFFTSEGQMYARTLLSDDNTIHFIKLVYKENNPLFNIQ